MIEDCIKLKLTSPKGCNTKTLEWFDELCKIKLEIEKEKKKKENKVQLILIKEKLKDLINQINDKFKEGKLEFFFYILTEHKPNGLEKYISINNFNELKEKYSSDKKIFIRNLRKLYHPSRYKSDKENELERYCIMQEISMKLNNLD